MAGAAGLLVLGGVTACADDSSSDSSAPAGDTSALPSNPATGDPIKIGYITPEGGAVSLPMVREGGEAAAQYLNNNGGGIGGHQVDLVVCEQQEDPASATACANQMVEDQVAAVISPLGAQGAVMLPIITGAGIPYISQAPVSQVEMVSENAYMLSGGIVAVLSGQAATAAQAGYKKFTVLVGDSGDAAASVQALGTPMFEQAGIELKVVTVPTGTADPTPQITAGLADNPDAVTILGDTGQCISSLKALQTVAPDVQKYLIASCLDKPVLDNVGNEAVAGAKAFTTVVVGADTESSDLYRSVMAEYAPDTDPAGLGYLGYQVVMSLGEVGESLTGPVTPEAIATAMSSAKDVPLPAAEGITFTCDGSAVPQLRALCSRAILVSDVTDDATLENTTAVNNGAN
ncbi:ABC transporter substrate-binding protein [Gordonia sp. LSe1-13]|uniref:ABC transporter substrate-binding protein n=1 Tax=Gordonia sesuvii TaxID=3116777 RepID=A0ABU7MDJ9_9ACTN|nr:ABC transporter substrate-binding protein [Gordonia sp. LSe1-13]